MGVIEPWGAAAVEATRSGRIGVLATAATIASGAYPRAVSAVSTRAETIGQAAPLLVPLAEEGWIEGDVPRLAVRRYLDPLAKANVDVVVLGCTHYPLLREVIEREARALLGAEVSVVDSARATASDVRAFLESRGLARPAGTERRAGEVEQLVTDMPKTFGEVGRVARLPRRRRRERRADRSPD